MGAMSRQGGLVRPEVDHDQLALIHHPVSKVAAPSSTKWGIVAPRPKSGLYQELTASALDLFFSPN